MTSRRADKGARRLDPPVDRPLVAHGWQLLVWTDFRVRWVALRHTVEKLERHDPAGYVNHPAAKFLKTLQHIVLEEVPSNPSSPAYLQGGTLGPAHRAWRRVSFHHRFRLFFRFSAKHKIIVYAWLNDENTLRKRGARTDPYAVFHSMLERGAPPGDWDDLVTASQAWSATDVP
ncbi:MAG TPA: type II toxin-antitoxin system YhaV family toxin [Longimicrobiaceae bacterium]|nr:type II toxin-antitoxin system YhaV family toxin [Longimicrobiaceae bacterium]